MPCAAGRPRSNLSVVAALSDFLCAVKKDNWSWISLKAIRHFDRTTEGIVEDWRDMAPHDPDRASRQVEWMQPPGPLLASEEPVFLRSGGGDYPPWSTTLFDVYWHVISANGQV
jgi:hypothetical protein